MENVAIKDIIFDKKSANYDFKADNFVASGEITVTITLHEYRQLIKDCATAQQRIDEANNNKYTRDAENEKLKKEVSELKAQLYELNKCNSIADINENTTAVNA